MWPAVRQLDHAFPNHFNLNARHVVTTRYLHFDFSFSKGIIFPTDKHTDCIISVPKHLQQHFVLYKMVGALLVKKFLAVQGTQRFITIFKSTLPRNYPQPV
jgi:hypothetical protein